MRLCLSCYHIWPGEAILCGHCGRSFGGRLCARRHLSPASARCCIQCGHPQLTESTASFPLGWIPLLLCLGAVLGSGLWLWHRVERPLLVQVQQVAVWTVILWLALMLLPGSFGYNVRRSLSRLCQGLWRLLFWGIGYRLVRDLTRIIAQVVAGNRTRSRY